MKDRQIRLGIAMTYLMGIVQVLVNILFTGALVRMLSEVEYGLYLLLGSLAAYISIFDFGLNNTISRYVAKYRLENDKRKEANLLGISFLLYAAIAVLILSAGLLLLGHIGFFIKDLRPENLGLARALFVLLVVNAAITLPLNSFSAVLVGYEQFIYTRTVSILRVLAMPLLSIPCLYLGGGSLSVVAVTTLTNVLAGFFNALYAFRKFHISLKITAFESAFAREVLGYSLAVFLGVLSDQLFFQTGSLVLGITRGAAEAAVFGLSNQLNQYLIAVAAAFSGVFLPRATSISMGGHSRDDLNAFFTGASRLLGGILLYILGGYLILGREFVRLWLGGRLNDVYAVSLLVMLPTVWTLSRAVGLSVMQAKNLHGFRSGLLLARAAFNILLCFPASAAFGYYGVAGCYGCCILVTNLILDAYYEKRVGIAVMRFSLSLIPIGVSAFFSACLIGVSYLFFKASPLAFLVRGGSYTVLFVLSVYRFYLNPKEKEKIRSLLHVKLPRIPDYGGQR